MTILFTRPVFKSCYQVEIIDGQSAILLSERGSHLLTGTALVVVSKLLNGMRCLDEIVEAAAQSVSTPEIFYALGELETLGVIREASNGLPAKTEAFWDSLGVDPATASRAIGRWTLALRTLGDVPAQALADSLCSLGFQIGDEGNAWIVLVDDYLRPELAALNEACLREGRPWLLARPVGSILWIGPILRPGKGVCWECVAHRLRIHRLSEGYVQWRKRDSYPRLAANYALPSTELAAVSLISTEMAKWCAGAPEGDLGRSLMTFDLSTLTTRRHAVVWRPQCPSCGDGKTASRRTPHPVPLTSRLKTFTADGGHRSATPEATLSRYGHLVSPLTGIVRGLEVDHGTDSTVAPIYTSGFNPATKDDSVESLRGHFRGTSSGKGKTELQAKASALCEAIERYCGVYDGTEIRVLRSFEALAEEAIRPNDCMRFSDAQYANRLENHADRYNRVPVPFDDHAEIDWTPLWSLSEERFKYLPTAYCYFGYPLSHDKRYCWSDSNGCAAGNSIEEAVLQGFLELVERDSVALWWFNQVKRPGVDLQSFDEPYISTLQSYYHSLHRDFWVLDITSDLAIPSFAAVSRRTDSPAEGITLGFGSHPDARIAILRAITEMNQFLPCVVTRTGESKTFQTTDDEALAWLSTSSLVNRPYLAPVGREAVAGDYPNWQHKDLAEDVADCVRIAADHGMETLVLDQTRPDIGLSVVRVVVPGLRHFWKRLGPGRLYDVPVTLGWVPSPLAEEDLNPMSVPF